MERLWAPWRIEYISGQRGRESKTGCVFCDAVDEQDDASRLVLGRGRNVFTIMNLFPYTNGHLMVVPNRHVGDITMLNNDEFRDIMAGVRDAVDILGATMNCDGYNVGMNLGRAAGAGIAEHVHMHVVPRWNGDTNFMAVVDDTKVVSEALDETYRKLRAEYEKRGLVTIG